MLLGREVVALLVYIHHTVQRVCRFFSAFPSEMKPVEASELSLIPTRRLYHAVASVFLLSSPNFSPRAIILFSNSLIYPFVEEYECFWKVSLWEFPDIYILSGRSLITVKKEAVALSPLFLRF